MKFIFRKKSRLKHLHSISVYNIEPMMQHKRFMTQNCLAKLCFLKGLLQQYS